MTEHDADDLERSLRRLARKTIPSGLRGRVLDAALESRKNAAWTPRMRAVVAVCSALIVVVLGVDRHIEKSEEIRIAALLGGLDVSEPAEQDTLSLQAELGMDLGDVHRSLRMGMALSRSWGRHDLRKALSEARDRLKGMIDHEDPEKFI